MIVTNSKVNRVLGKIVGFPIENVSLGQKIIPVLDVYDMFWEMYYESASKIANGNGAFSQSLDANLNTDWVYHLTFASFRASACDVSDLYLAVDGYGYIAFDTSAITSFGAPIDVWLVNPDGSNISFGGTIANDVGADTVTCYLWGRVLKL